MYFIIFILLFISCLLFYLYYKEKNKHIEIEQINENVRKENELIDNAYNQKQEALTKIQETINNAEQISQKAFENYIDILDKEYEKKEQEQEAAINLLKESYINLQNEILAEIGSARVDLDKISATRAAAIQAQLKEEKIQQQEQFYSLSIDDIDKREVKILQSIEDELRDPRPIRMII